MSREIYLDNNATTQPLPEVRNEMLVALDAGFGNASSVHTGGDRARSAIRTARDHVATLLGVEAETLIFTSGATEANNLAIASAFQFSNQPQSLRFVTTSVEHSSILNVARHWAERGVNVAILAADVGGHIDLDALAAAISVPTSLVSVQWANNETGVIHPIAEISRLCAARGVPLHVDAAQALGKLPLDIKDLPIDFLSATAHKIHGPPGCGVLYIRKRSQFRPSLFGGFQEQGLRPGTENVPGIVGFGAAARLRQPRLDAIGRHCRQLRDHFEQSVMRLVPDVAINGDPDRRLDNTTNLRFAGVDGQALVARLDQLGVRCSQSSACTNHRPEPSYVLRAMGLSETDAYSSVRFSVSELNTLAEMDMAAETIADLCHRLRAFRSRLTYRIAKPMEVH